MLEDAILIDIDNTIVNTNVVFDKVKDKPKKEQFQYFYNHVDDCKPIWWAIDIVKKMSKDYYLVFLTGRGVECKEQTVEQLRKLGFKKFSLAMRTAGDITTPDFEMKRKLLKSLVAQYRFIFAIDDKEENCKVYKEEFDIPSLVVYYPENERY